MRTKLMVTALSLLMAGNASAAPIDSINGSLQPGAQYPNLFTSFASDNGLGWYYTPSIDYDLDGIASRFQQGNSTATTVPKTVRLQFWNERPAAGGSLLREAVFDVIPRDGGDAGGTFTSLRLTAGTRYFVSVIDVAGVGLNVGTWRNVGGVPQPAFGAVNLGAYWRSKADGFATETSGSNVFTLASDGSGGQYEVLGSAPVLVFSGAYAPEPSTLVAFGALVSLSLTRRRAVL